MICWDGKKFVGESVHDEDALSIIHYIDENLRMGEDQKDLADRMGVRRRKMAEIRTGILKVGNFRGYTLEKAASDYKGTTKSSLSDRRNKTYPEDLRLTYTHDVLLETLGRILNNLSDDLRCGSAEACRMKAAATAPTPKKVEEPQKKAEPEKQQASIFDESSVEDKIAAAVKKAIAEILAPHGIQLKG